MNDLDRSIAVLRRRVRQVLMIRHAAAFAAVGAALSCALAIIGRKFETLGFMWLYAAPVLAGATSGALYGALRRMTAFAVARAAERRLDLKERLSSSVSLSSFAGRDEAVDALLRDAVENLKGLDPRAAFPHIFTRGLKALLLLISLLLGLVFLPQVPALQTEARRAEIQVIKQEGRHLLRLAKNLEEVSAPNREVAKRIANNMKALGKQMQSGRMSRKRAMLATKKLTREIAEAQNKLADQIMAKADRTAQDAGKEFKEMGGMLDPEAARKMKAMAARLDELSAAAKLGRLTPDQMKEFQELSKQLAGMKSALQMSPEMMRRFADLLSEKDYQGAMIDLLELARKLREGKLSHAEMRKLAAEVRMLSVLLKGTEFDKLCPLLKLAAAALEKGDAKMAADKLEEAARLGLEIASKLKDLMRLARAGAG